jgi:hypothetical protein
MLQPAWKSGHSYRCLRDGLPADSRHDGGRDINRGFAYPRPQRGPSATEKHKPWDTRDQNTHWSAPRHAQDHMHRPRWPRDTEITMSSIRPPTSTPVPHDAMSEKGCRQRSDSGARKDRFFSTIESRQLTRQDGLGDEDSTRHQKGASATEQYTRRDTQDKDRPRSRPRHAQDHMHRPRWQSDPDIRMAPIRHHTSAQVQDDDMSERGRRQTSDFRAREDGFFFPIDSRQPPRQHRLGADDGTTRHEAAHRSNSEGGRREGGSNAQRHYATGFWVRLLRYDHWVHLSWSSTRQRFVNRDQPRT